MQAQAPGHPECEGSRPVPEGTELNRFDTLERFRRY